MLIRPTRRQPPYDDGDLHWWEGWDPAALFRVGLFAIPAVIIVVLLVDSIVTTIIGS